jgi:long-chain acyl-CoA synthetase
MVLDKTSTQEYIEKLMQSQEHYCEWESKKMIKSPLFHLATEQNGISWILVFYKPARKTPIYPTITEDDYEYILNHSGAIFCFVSDAEILQK